MMRAGILFTLAFFLASCTTTGLYVAPSYEHGQADPRPPASEITYRVFLIGDAGGARREPLSPALATLRERLSRTDTAAAVLFLGDNLYCCGLPDSLSPDRPAAEERLLAQIDAVRDFRGRVFFLPGNHDWNRSRPGGLDAVRRQEAFVEAHLPDRPDAFIPDDGFPGPHAVRLADDLVLLALDTEWWLTEEDKATGDDGDYDIESREDVLIELVEQLRKHRKRHILVAGHHPLFSNGVHGGHVSLKEHLFPLTAKWPSAYVPLPLVGSLYPLFLSTVGGPQDLAHHRYRSLREGLLRVFEGHEGPVIYAAGHDHSLQYFRHGNLHHLVSGAGSRPQPVAGGGKATFTYGGGEGFMEVTYYRDGTVWLDAIAADRPGGRVLFSTRLNGPLPERVDPGIPDAGPPPDYRDSTQVAVADARLAAGPLHRFFFGAQHRKAWTTPVRAPLLDPWHEAGGLTPIKRGGGLQTTSLRLAGHDGHQYVLRSLTKDPTRSLPENLRRTLAADVFIDQNSIQHPYGAFIIPPLAEAAGIYHTNPRLVYVPRDDRLGIYRDTFADRLMMFEERPDDDMSDVPGFGGSRKVISATRLFEAITGDNDHRVDARFFARSRLFDMYLSDWDRHRDQWRWASFEPYELDSTLTGDDRTEGKVYRPIPRDRDWAFNRMGGLFPSLIKNRYIQPKFQDFTDSYGYLKGLNGSGMVQDRRFLSELTRGDWIALGEDLRRRLTDEAIEEALHRWPRPIYDEYAGEFRRLLRIRREKLPDVAERYYELLAETVDVVGSDKHETFVVSRLNDEATEVVVFKTRKDGTRVKELYRRTFFRSETREIRLYGLGGRDRFEISGRVDRGIHLIVVGGPGEDAFIDRSLVQSGPHALFIDTPTGNEWHTGPDDRERRTDDPHWTLYDPHNYGFDERIPQLFFGSNKDDGLFLGGGVRFVHKGFNRRPYAWQQKLLANFAATTRAFNLVYSGRFTEALGPWTLGVDATIRSPNNIRNFLGLGNGTDEDPSVDRFRFYQARLSQVWLSPTIRRETPAFRVYAGPFFSYTDVRFDAGRFLATPQAGISPDTFEEQWFAGAGAGVALAALDHPRNPTGGLRLQGDVRVHLGVHNTSARFTRLSSTFAFYATPSYHPRVTFAARLGVTHNIGSFPFFESNTLGGKDNLRGFRSTRFAGRTSFFQNLELRFGLADFSSYLAAGSAGLLVFLDNGRVWTEADDARGLPRSLFRGYHQGFGGGLWADVLDLVVLTTTADLSSEDALFTLRFGFFF